MKTIVITGSTKGIGYGLADSFLKLGCEVVVSGRGMEAVEAAVAQLSAEHDSGRILGQPCDVTNFEQVQALWDAAAAKFGKVDVWINNAGQSHPIKDFWTLDIALMDEIVKTNLIGSMYGSKVALNGMLAQGFGALYNMEGAGSTGRIHPGMILYGSTKRGGNLLIAGLAKELEGKPVIVGGLSPGMVVTGLADRHRAANPEGWEQTKRIFNIIGDRVENVTPWLAERILENQKNGATISYISGMKIMWRFLTARFSKRDLFTEEEG